MKVELVYHDHWNDKEAMPLFRAACLHTVKQRITLSPQCSGLMWSFVFPTGAVTWLLTTSPPPRPLRWIGVWRLLFPLAAHLTWHTSNPWLQSRTSPRSGQPTAPSSTCSASIKVIYQGHTHTDCFEMVDFTVFWNVHFLVSLCITMKRQDKVTESESSTFSINHKEVY